VDAAARVLNELLAQHPAQPHLAKEDGVWRLHHHPADAPLVPMWTAICAEGLARVVGLPSAQRLGTCEREGCGRVFVDVSRNASRRFCSLACQNRVKAASFRARQVGAVASRRSSR
jgi:predicted RNA-binding Zn ribbon-like protein